MNWEFIFPGKLRREGTDEERTLYRIDFPDGFGRLTASEVLPGVLLVFNDFHTSCGFRNEAPRPGFIEINHCLRGRYECVLRDGRHLGLGPQDLAFSDMGSPADYSTFVSGEYYGLSILLHIEEAERALNSFLGERIHIGELFEHILCEGLFVLRADPEIQHIVSEIYHAPARARHGYYRLKAAELLLFVMFRRADSGAPLFSGYCRGSVPRAEEAARRLTEDLKRHYTLAELAVLCRVSETTLKKEFKKVYGETPGQYLKRRRMEQAALLLGTTRLSVGEVAETVGYRNAGKFSAAFTERFGISPRLYKKDAVLEQNACFGAGTIP